MPFLHDRNELFGRNTIKGITSDALPINVAQKIYEHVYVESIRIQKHQVNNKIPPFLAFPLRFMDYYCRSTEHIRELGLVKTNINQKVDIPAFWIVATGTLALLNTTKVDGSLWNSINNEFSMNLSSDYYKSLLQNFYIENFGGESYICTDDKKDIIHTCQNICESCNGHIFILHVNNNENNDNNSKPNLQIISALSFAMFPLSNVIQDVGGKVGGFIKWMATSDNFYHDELSFQRRGFNSQLLSILQCILSPDITIRPINTKNQKGKNSKKKNSQIVVNMATLFTKHGVGSNTHDAAIFFWHYSKFRDANEKDDIDFEFRNEIRPILEAQSDPQLILVKGTTPIWIANPIRFPLTYTIVDILGNVIFPYFNIPNPNSPFHYLYSITRDQNEKISGFYEREKSWKTYLNTSQSFTSFTTIWKPCNLNLKDDELMDMTMKLHEFHIMPAICHKRKEHCSIYDVYSTIAMSYFNKLFQFNNKYKKNLSIRFRTYMAQAYSRLSRAPHLDNEGEALEWLPNLWKHIKNHVKDSIDFDSIPEEDVRQSWIESPLFEEDFTMRIPFLYHYADMIRNLPQFRGSLLDFWFLNTLADQRDFIHANETSPDTETSRSIKKKSNHIIYQDDDHKHTVELDNYADDDYNDDHHQEKSEGDDSPYVNNNKESCHAKKTSTPKSTETSASPKQNSTRETPTTQQLSRRRLPFGAIKRLFDDDNNNPKNSIHKNIQDERKPAAKSNNNTTKHDNNNTTQNDDTSSEDDEEETDSEDDTSDDEKEKNKDEEVIHDESYKIPVDDIPHIGPSVMSLAACAIKHRKDRNFFRSKEWKEGGYKNGSLEDAMQDYNTLDRRHYTPLFREVRDYNLEKLLSNLTKLLPCITSNDKVPQSKEELMKIAQNYTYREKKKNKKLTKTQLQDVSAIFDKVHHFRNFDITSRVEILCHDTTKAVMMLPKLNDDDDDDDDERPIRVQFHAQDMQESDLSWDCVKDVFLSEVEQDLQDISKQDSFRGQFFGPICANHLMLESSKQKTNMNKNWNIPIPQPPTDNDDKSITDIPHHIITKISCIFKKKVTKIVRRNDGVATKTDVAHPGIQGLYEIVTVPCDPPTSRTDSRAAWYKQSGGEDLLEGLPTTSTIVSREFIYTVLANRPKQLEDVMEMEKKAQNQCRGTKQHVKLYGDRVIIPSQTNQMCALKFIPGIGKQPGQWEGAFTPYDLGNNKNSNLTMDNERHHQIVTLDWLLENFSQDYLDQVKNACLAGQKRYTNVPIGDVNKELDMSMLDNVLFNIPINYKQESEKVCYGYAIANMMYQMGHVILAEDLKKLSFIHKEKKPRPMEKEIANCVETYFKNHTDLFCIPQNITHEDAILQLPKKVIGHNPPKKDTAIILVLKDADGTSCHAIGIMDEIIYDSNCTHAVGISQNNLNLLSGTEFKGIAHGRQWTILQRSSIRKRNRRNNNNKKKQKNNKKKKESSYNQVG